MASVNLKKHTIKSAKRILRHNDKESRMGDNHTNPHIDKSKTKKNLSAPPKGWTESTYDLEDKYARFDERLAQLDAAPNAKRKRKDRPVLLSLHIPCPAAVQDKKKWFGMVVNHMMDEFGEENFISGEVHVDEVHDYLDPKTKEVRTSLESMHIDVIPEKDGILDCKSVYTRDLPTRLNDWIEDMTLSQFGVHFLTGERTVGDDVETVKTASTKALIEERQAVAEEKSLIFKTLKIADDMLKEENALFKTMTGAQKSALKEAAFAQAARREKVKKQVDSCNEQYDTGFEYL